MRKVTIKGLTDSTISFTNLKITLRGNSNRPDYYTNSIAKHIEITSSEQEREIMSLAKSGFIKIIEEKDETSNVVMVNSINIPEANTLKEEPQEEPKEEKEQTSHPSQQVKHEMSGEPEESVVVINDAGEIIKTKTFKASQLENKENKEVVQASLEAMEKIEKEEKEDLENYESGEEGDDVTRILEKDVTAQMNDEVVVVTDKGKAVKTKMKNYITDATDKKTEKKAEKKASKKVEETPFLEPPDDDDKKSDAFIEI